MMPAVLLALVLLATLYRGRAVRSDAGVSAWAFTEARGIQRWSGAAFALSTVAIAAAAIGLALAATAPSPALLWSGTLIAAAGALIVLVAQVQMGKAWRVGVRAGDAPLFVTAGLFRYSRNPIFVGMILMAAGIAIAASTPWAAGAALCFAMACAAQVRIEEAHLSQAFGDAYAGFRRTTPRWLGL